jgi:opacity protein-like surface antigen
MKHRLFPLVLFSALVLFTDLSTGKAQQLDVGDMDLNLSLGYGTPWVFREGYQTNMIPVGLSFDYGLSDNLGPGILSIGAYLGATTYSEEINDILRSEEYGRKGTLIAIAVRSTYHYQLVDEIDTYAFLHFGLGYEDWKAYGEVPFYANPDLDSVIRPVFGLGIGAKYYFSSNLCVLAEIGYSTAFFKLGMGIRL